jgi:hypothetical protein
LSGARKQRFPFIPPSRQSTRESSGSSITGQ